MSRCKGFSHVELFMVMILIGVLGTVTVSLVRDTSDSGRADASLEKMRAIKTAILGNREGEDGGQRGHWGYFGDMGSLPESLANLTTQGTQVGYTFDATYGFGSGWRGPYLSETFLDGDGITKDAWGRNFVWRPEDIPPTLTSLGADGAAGGAGYDSDIVLSFPENDRLSVVSGILRDGNAPMPGKTLEIRYPVKGIQNSFATYSGSEGNYTFASVPFGLRSLRVTTTPPNIGILKLAVNKPKFSVSEEASNTGDFLPGTSAGHGDTENVIRVGGVQVYSDNDYDTDLVSSHDDPRTLVAIRICWNDAGLNARVTRLNFGGAVSTWSNFNDCETRTDFNGAHIIQSGVQTHIEVDFSKNMGGRALSFLLTWDDGTQDDWHPMGGFP